MAGNNKKNNENELTVKEASSKLDISESTVKKYLKDFDLDFEKGSGTKAVISEETFQALSEIAKLRANGLSIQEIKELKSQEPSKNILDEIEETESTQKKEESQKEDKNGSEPEAAITSEDESLAEEDLAESEEGSEEKEELSRESILEEETEGTTERRRRGFNYRYVERQISNDSKRVGSLRLRLRNTNLSVQERLFVEEALERRILFLDGWKHILRWISK